jgi:hypothetical protein
MPGRRTPPMEERVDQRAAWMARGRMDDQAGRLVDGDHVLVLVDDRQRDRLGDQLEIDRRRDLDVDPIAGAHAVAGLGHDVAADRDVAVVEEPLDLRAGQRGVVARDERVEPGAGIGGHRDQRAATGRGALAGGLPRVILVELADLVGVVRHQILDFTCPLDFTRTSTIARS